MNGSKKFDDYRIKFVVSLFVILFFLIPSVSTAATKADLAKFQRSISSMNDRRWLVARTSAITQFADLHS